MTHCSDGSKVFSFAVDYKIWGLLQNGVYQTRINDMEHLNQRLKEEWSRFDVSVIDHAISEWCFRLPACVKAIGVHFEHHLFWVGAEKRS